MAQTGYTPIQLYYSTTASAVPTNTNLANGELAINITDGKLYYKDNTGTVKLLTSTGSEISPITNNGVVYINGSGQATSGSALTFDGTNLGVGTSSPATKLNVSVYGAISTTIDRVGDYGQSLQFVRNGVTGNAGFGLADQNQLGIYLNSGEVGRWTSTGLGIGTNSPQSRLEVRQDQSGAITRVIANNAFANTGAGSSFDYYFGTTRLGGLTHAFASGAYLGFDVWSGSSATERMRLDSAGNLGLGTAPSAWSDHKVLQVGAWSSFGSYNGNLNAQMMNNAYWDGSAYRYIGSSQASYFSTVQGSFQWNIAASGTAGNPISFTQAMTLDASGRLGVGNTSPAYILDIDSKSNSPVIRLTSSASGQIPYRICANIPGVSNAGFSIYDDTASVNRLVIDSSGNVGIGTSSPTQKLTLLNAAGTYGTTYQPIMQIGNTSSGGTLTATGLGAIVWSTDGLGTPVASIEGVRESPGSGAASSLYFRTGSSGGGTTRAILSSNGNFTITTAGKTSISANDTTAYAAGVGASVDLGGNYRSAGDYQTFVRVAAEKANGTDADYGYNMAFYTTTNGGSSMGNRVVTLLSTGAVAFGTSNTNYGSSGQVLTSQGAGSPPIWAAGGGGSSQWTTSGTQIYYNTGNVGIGTASPDTYADGGKNLTILSSSSSTRAQLAIVGTQSTANEILGRINFTNTNSTNTAYRVALIDGIRGSDNNSGYLTFSTGYTTSPSERMRIDENGRVGIGTTSATANLARLQVTHDANTERYGIYVPGGSYVGSGPSGTQYGGYFTPNTSNVASGVVGVAGIITQSGAASSLYGVYGDGGSQASATNFGVYGTARQGDLNGPGHAYGGYFNANTSGSGSGGTGVTMAVRAFNASTIGGGAYGVFVNTVAGATSIYGLYYEHAGSLQFRVKTNGGIDNYSSNNTNLSDRREKTDFAPAKSYLDTICAIPVQTFKYINQEDDLLTLGVVAQDVQAVAPELVAESDWGTLEEPKMRLSVYETDLVYALMKSIQELKTIVDAQAVEIAALKGAA